MLFAERYSNSVNSSNLQDDEFHRRTEALQASALASLSVKTSLGSLLTRIKFADGIAHKDFEGHPENIAQLLRAWVEEVRRRGKERGWLPVPRTEWDAQANEAFYRKVAEISLAYWLDSRCTTCEGTGVQVTQHACPACKGTKLQPLTGGRLIVERSQEMSGELEGIFQSHNSRAAGRLRRVA